MLKFKTELSIIKIGTYLTFELEMNFFVVYNLFTMPDKKEDQEKFKSFSFPILAMTFEINNTYYTCPKIVDTFQLNESILGALGYSKKIQISSKFGRSS